MNLFNILRDDFVPVRKKMTQKQVMEYARVSRRLGWSMIDFSQYLEVCHWIKDGLFGKPLVHMREFESNPGVWMFTCNDGTLMLISDHHRKNVYRGTALEFCANDPNFNIELVFGRFFKSMKRQLKQHDQVSD